MGTIQFTDIGRPTWQLDAACRDTDPEVFYPDRGASTREAKSYCSQCPVRDQCLDFALMNGEKFGIWGGKSERERRKIKKRRTELNPNWRKELRQQYGIVKSDPA